jgi:hypothetical protein
MFLPRPAWHKILLLKAFYVAGITGICHTPGLLAMMGVSLSFCPLGPQTAILSVSPT